MKIASKTYRLTTLLLAAGLLVACGGSDRFDNDGSGAVPNAEEDPVIEASGGEAPVEAVSSDRAQKLVDMCIAEGASAEVCTCQIKAVEDGLDQSDFVRLVDLAEAGNEADAKTMLANIMSDNPHIATKMSSDMLKCAIN